MRRYIAKTQPLALSNSNSAPARSCTLSFMSKANTKVSLNSMKPYRHWHCVFWYWWVERWTIKMRSWASSCFLGSWLVTAELRCQQEKMSRVRILFFIGGFSSGGPFLLYKSDEWMTNYMTLRQALRIYWQSSYCYT